MSQPPPRLGENASKNLADLNETEFPLHWMEDDRRYSDFLAFALTLNSIYFETRIFLMIDNRVRPKNVTLSNREGQNLETRFERDMPFSEMRTIYSSNGNIRDHTQRSCAFCSYVSSAKLQPVTSLIFHYTDQKAFREISKRGVLWLSEYRSLNDATEFTYAWDLLKLLTSNGFRGEGEYFRDCFALLEAKLAKLDFYVCSFSTNGNALSQWRAYAGENGVSLGIAECVFPRFVGGFSPFRLAPVVYERSMQVELLKPVADAARFLLQSRASPADFVKTMHASHIDAFVEHAITFKHKGFEEEEEIRLISDGTNHQIRTREDSSGNRIRYLGLDLYEEVRRAQFVDFPFYEINIAPTNDPDERITEINALLVSLKIKCLNILDSTIPFRWPGAQESVPSQR